MRVLGITGGTGAGKSVLCAELERCGAEIIDADLISRQLTKRGGAAFDDVVNEFGSEILKADGEIDRGALAKIVFNDSKKLELLNRITHKYIFAEIRRRLARCKKQLAVLDVPLLFSCDFPIKCDLTVAVIAPEAVRVQRIIARDGIDREAALARIKNQMTNDEYAAKADLCFINDGAAEKIKRFAKELCRTEQEILKEF